MRDKALERKIELLREFIGEWVKFRDFLTSSLKAGKVSAEDERKFLELKSLIARKHQGLMQTLGEEFPPDQRLMDIISHAVSLESLVGTSGMQFRKIENDWHLSYIHLNEVLGTLETKREVMAKISRAQLVLGSLSRRARGLIRVMAKVVIIIVALAIVVFVMVGYFFGDEREVKRKGRINYVVTTVKGWIGVAEEEPEKTP